jgi:hypothetical protein
MSRVLLCLLGGIFVALLQGGRAEGFTLTEFLADEVDGLPWIEIYHSGEQGASLSGWSLSVDPSNEERVPVPSVMVNRRSYRAFVLGEQEGRVDLGLDRDGGYLALIDPEGAVASVFQDYP